jgi:hypothetical protein
MSTHIEVTFRSLGRSKRVHIARFECGADNARLIIQHAWRHNSEVVKTSRYARK